jgi:adenosylcobinamide-GDP ribazoletransferase
MLLGIKFLQYGRPEGGLGTDFFSNEITLRSMAGIFLPVLLSLLLGMPCVWLNISFMAVALGMLYYYKRKINCITGDMLGALAEIEETILFLIACLRVGQ